MTCSRSARLAQTCAPLRPAAAAAQVRASADKALSQVSALRSQLGAGSSQLATRNSKLSERASRATSVASRRRPPKRSSAPLASVRSERIVRHYNEQIAREPFRPIRAARARRQSSRSCRARTQSARARANRPLPSNLKLVVGATLRQLVCRWTRAVGLRFTIIAIIISVIIIALIPINRSSAP